MRDKKLKLLIADDHRLFIEGLRYVLKHELNMEICGVAMNGKEAADKCGSENIDVVLMDINMPVMDGIQSTATIKQMHPSVKVIIVTTQNDLTTITRAIKAGVDGYVLKNAGTDDLISAFKAVRKNEIFVSESIAHFVTDDTSNIKSRTDYIQFSENLITPREHAVLKLIAEGFTNQQIADTFNLSVKTVDTHRKNLLAKLNLPNTAALVKFAIENKLV